jgi:hypothetical protein
VEVLFLCCNLLLACTVTYFIYRIHGFTGLRVQHTGSACPREKERECASTQMDASRVFGASDVIHTSAKLAAFLWPSFHTSTLVLETKPVSFFATTKLQMIKILAAFLLVLGTDVYRSGCSFQVRLLISLDTPHSVDL